MKLNLSRCLVLAGFGSAALFLSADVRIKAFHLSLPALKLQRTIGSQNSTSPVFDQMHQTFSQAKAAMRRILTHVQLNTALADGGIGENTNYFFDLNGIGVVFTMALPTNTDCSSGGGELALVNALLCAAGSAASVNGFGTYAGSAGGVDYTLRVSIPGGEYRYLVEIWAAPTGNTQHRMLTLYRNESGSKFYGYIVTGVDEDAPGWGAKFEADLTDPNNENYSVYFQWQADTSTNTWAQADSWRDWDNRILAMKFTGSGDQSQSKFTATMAVNFNADPGNLYVTIKFLQRVGATYSLAYGGAGYNDVETVLPSNPWQCVDRANTSSDPDVSLYVVRDSGDTLADALTSGHCNFVDASEEATLTGVYAAIPTANTQSNLELFDNQTNFPFTWWNASDAAPTP